MEVNGTPLVPRQELTAAPYALFALDADQLDGLDSTAFLQSVPVPLTLSGTSATHIIRAENAATTADAVAVHGLATGSSGTTYGGWFESASDSGRGVFGHATAGSISPTYGVYGQSDSLLGRGVYGVATSSGGGITHGVYGQSASTSGSGVFGYATALSGSTYGGRFQSDSTSGRGVVGEATANSGTTYGGWFESASDSGRGVFGHATASSISPTYGVYGQSDSLLGRGVYGVATSSGGGITHGVYGQSASTSGSGVFGYATADSGTTYAGMFTSMSPNGLGGLFENDALGDAFDVELSGPNGAINTPGFLYREYTASTRSAAIPIAYGSIAADGTINSGTGNFTVVHTVTGQYDITISGETYSNTGFTVTITPITNSPRITGVADAGAGFRVNMWNLSGTLVDNAFQFTIWTANPSEPG